MKRQLAIMAIVVSAGLQAQAAEQHGGDILYTEPVDTVLFSHRFHVEKRELPCDLCHARLFRMQAKKAQESPDFTMHSLMDGRYCGACHNGLMAFASNTRCGDCHTGMKRSGGAAR